MADAPACFPAATASCLSICGSICGQSIDSACFQSLHISAQDIANLGAEHSKQQSDRDDVKAPKLSVKGQRHADSVTPFWTVFDQMLRNVYDPVKNPTGIINMGIANNSLMDLELQDFFSNNLRLELTDFTYGTSLHGSTRLFEALCKHFNGPDFSPVEQVKEEHLLTGPGAGPLLDQVFEILANPGEACLVAAPTYNGFDADLAIRAGVRLIPVYSQFGDGSGTAREDFTGETSIAGFEKALDDAKAKGITVRAILLCNPHNPIGRCYSRSALLAYGAFAQKHNLHLVFDEIYSLSVFPTSDDPNPQPFISALAVDWAAEIDCDARRVHIITSASKDWGLNGFRLGTFISQHNKEMISAMKVTTKLYMLSSPADALYSALLMSDTDALSGKAVNGDSNGSTSASPLTYTSFIKLNRSRLTSAYERVKKWLVHHKIRYEPSNAGHFLLIDLAPYLPDKLDEKTGETSTDSTATQPGRALTDPLERETALWSRCLAEGVCLTPGSNYHHPHTGWFRLTFSMKEDVAREGLSRLERALNLDAMKW